VLADDALMEDVGPHTSIPAVSPQHLPHKRKNRVKTRTVDDEVRGSS
jgi:hypothetical protein